MARTNTNTYYDYRLGRRKPKKRRLSSSMLLFLCDTIVFVATILLAAAIVVCLLTPNISPEKMGILSIVVLAAPIIYIAEIILSLYRILRWRWNFAVFSLIFVVAGLFSIGKYYRLDFKQKAEVKINERHYTKVMSYNIATAASKALIDSIKSVRPNILCLQEYLSDHKEIWKTLGSNYNSTCKDNTSFSCEIFSRYPILKQGLIDTLPRTNALWADIKIQNDTVRVINLHLKSTTITTQDMQFVEEHEYILDSSRTSKVKDMVKRLTQSNIQRAYQSQSIAEFIKNSPHKKIIVCGDFNDVPLSYCQNTISENLQNTFIEAGSGYSYTFAGFFKLLQIDYMLCSEHFEVVSYNVDHSLNFSDHYPIISRLKLNKK